MIYEENKTFEIIIDQDKIFLFINNSTKKNVKLLIQTNLNYVTKYDVLCVGSTIT